MSKAQPERLEQYKVCEFIDEKYPNTLYTSSIAGLKLPAHLGQQLSACGYRKGTPDLLIFEPRKIYNGLFIEMKTNTGKPSKEQLEFQQLARQRGYASEICYGREQAVEVIKTYLG